MTDVARITLHRTDPGDVQIRQVLMSIDGAHLATLLYGQTSTHEIPAGRHALRANNTLVWKTLEFDARGGDDLHFRIVNRAPWGMNTMIAAIGVGVLLVTLEPMPGIVTRSS